MDHVIFWQFHHIACRVGGIIHQDMNKRSWEIFFRARGEAVTLKPIGAACLRVNPLSLDIVAIIVTRNFEKKPVGSTLFYWLFLWYAQV